MRATPREGRVASLDDSSPGRTGRGGEAGCSGIACSWANLTTSRSWGEGWGGAELSQRLWEGGPGVGWGRVKGGQESWGDLLIAWQRTGTEQGGSTLGHPLTQILALRVGLMGHCRRVNL